MPTIHTLLAFALASTLLAIVPGPNVLYIITRGIEQGRKAGLVSALGVETGTLFHIVAATLGLSALVASSDLVFSIVKYTGAVYLVLMGHSCLRAQVGHGVPSMALQRVNYRRAYSRGLVVNLLNPKVALFFVAFLPQFVDPARGHTSSQILVLGLTFLVLTTLSDCSYAVASGAIGAWMKTRERASRQRDRIAGVVYILLGAFAAVTGSGTAQGL
jgi:threonine/homoserine/homoserine lactone efflux protein